MVNVSSYDLVIEVSLNEPHTSRKLGTVVMYTNKYEKKRTISILGWYNSPCHERKRKVY